MKRNDNILSVYKEFNNSERSVRMFNTRNNFLKDNVTTSILSDKIVILKANISSHNTRKWSKNNNSFQIKIYCDVPTGDYLIDEEDSTEDKLVIYLEDKIK